MVVGTALVELRVHASQSLKQKRGVVRSISRRLRNRFNVSVAEVGGQGTWQRAVLGIAVAGSNALRVRQHLEQALEFIEELHLAEVGAAEIELLETGYTDAGGDVADEAEDWPAHWIADEEKETDVPPDRTGR